MALVLTHPTLARRDAPFHTRGRSERRGKSYSVPYVEPLSDASTKLADFFNILSITKFDERMLIFAPRLSHFHPQLQEHLHTEDALHLKACLGSHRF